jgi:hypothetical protein
MTQVNGNIISLTKKYVLERYGQESMDNLVRGLTDSVSAVVSEDISSHIMYDVRIYQELLRGFEKSFGRREFQELARFMVNHQVGPFFRFIVRFFSVDSFMNQAKGMWRKIYSDGFIELKKIHDNNYIMTVTDLDFTDPQMWISLHYLVEIMRIGIKKSVEGVFKRMNSTTTEFNFSLGPKDKTATTSL